VTTIVLFSVIVACLVAALVWALCPPAMRKSFADEPASLEEVGPRHCTYLPLVRQALSAKDFSFLESRRSGKLAKRLRKERRRIALSYLANLHDDFLRLLRVAKAIATLSAEIATAQELERIWLSFQFAFRYRVLWIGLFIGLPSLGRLDGLSQMVSELAVRMETAISELGERAAIAAQVASSLDRRSVDLV
jgi:hypothetical protein